MDRTPGPTTDPQVTGECKTSQSVWADRDEVFGDAGKAAARNRSCVLATISAVVTMSMPATCTIPGCSLQCGSATHSAGFINPKRECRRLPSPKIASSVD
jgi:hypothetical protein